MRYLCPDWPGVRCANTKEPMLATAGAVKDVDVWNLFVGMAFQGLDFVVLRMPAARPDKLVMFQMLDMALLEEAFREGGHLGARTCRDLRLGQRLALGHAAVAEALRLRVRKRDGRKSLRCHAIVQIEAPKSNVNVSPVATVNVAP